MMKKNSIFHKIKNVFLNFIFFFIRGILNLGEYLLFLFFCKANLIIKGSQKKALAKTTNIQNLNDLELVASYKLKKDKSIISELFKRYVKFVFTVCMKYFKDVPKSEEAVMEIFEKLFTDLLKHNIQNFKSWLHVVTKNHCLNTLRKETYIREKKKTIKYATDIFMESQTILYHDNENNSETKLNNLQMALDNLSEKQKRCIELFYLEEKCYEEITKITGYTLNQVKSYIQNGKRNMKIFLTKQQ